MESGWTRERWIRVDGREEGNFLETNLSAAWQPWLEKFAVIGGGHTVISTRSRWRAAFVGERETSAALSAVSCSLSGSDSFPLSLPSLLISKSDVCNASMRRRRDETHPLSLPLSFSFARRVVVPARRSSSFFSWMDRCDRRSSFFLRAANLEQIFYSFVHA